MSKKGRHDEPSQTISRRGLLQLGGAVGATLIGAGVAHGQDKKNDETEKTKSGEPAARPKVPRKTLGRTGETVPILLFGGAVTLDPHFDPKLAEALRYGVNYIDAADCYSDGNCEPAVGAFHTRAKVRDQLWITSKSDEHEPKGFEATLETSLKKLQTDRIDLYFLHALEDPKLLSKELEQTVARLIKSGKMRHFGFSCHHGNVVELLNKAAEVPWVESVMFRYNFRQYGDKELNAAIDRAHKANVGLIAMKTQASEASFDKAWKPFHTSGKWTKHQAVLKAVWADERITAAVSHMDSLEKLRQNIAAALDKSGLTRAESDAIYQYAQTTRHLSCDGCDHICGPHVDAPVQIGDTMRYLMYHDTYGEPDKARRLFASLPTGAQKLDGIDFSRAQAACPHGVLVADLMARAAQVLPS